MNAEIVVVTTTDIDFLVYPSRAPCSQFVHAAHQGTGVLAGIALQESRPEHHGYLLLCQNHALHLEEAVVNEQILERIVRLGGSASGTALKVCMAKRMWCSRMALESCSKMRTTAGDACSSVRRSLRSWRSERRRGANRESSSLCDPDTIRSAQNTTSRGT